MPGTFPFLMAGLAAGVGLLYGSARTARWGRRGLTLLLALYAVLSLQGTSDLLVWSLAVPHQAIWRASDAPGIRVIVVLGNGAVDAGGDGRTLAIVNVQSGSNALEAARVYRVLGGPSVIASGGRPPGTGTGSPESQALAAALVRCGVPEADVVQESSSPTTRDQAVNVGRLLRERGETRFVLVTAPEHMRRAAGAFRALGFEPLPSPSWLRYGGRPFWRPTLYALGGSTGALYQYVALVYYRLRGWS